MAERPPREGWRVAQRRPLFAALTTLAFVAVMLGVAGYAYERTIAPKRTLSVQPFPAPGIESAIHDGAGDPVRPQPAVRPDREIEAAKDAVVAEGLPGWRR